MLQKLERCWLPVIIMKPIARFIEGTGISPNALTRTERIVLLVLALVFNLLTLGLWLLAICKSSCKIRQNFTCQKWLSEVWCSLKLIGLFA